MSRIVSREDWLKERIDLLEKEKAFNKQRDALTIERQALPWVRIEKEYIFDGPDGRESLADLFGDCSQLLVYHFMYDPSWGDEACKSCSYWADNLNGVDVHLKARDVSFALISKATLAQIEVYRGRMSWSLKWVSSYENDFNLDYHVGFTPEEMETGEAFYNYHVTRVPREQLPGASVFVRKDGEVYHTYSTYGRGIDMINGAYHMLDLVPKGRDEASLSWNQEWIRRHDEY